MKYSLYKIILFLKNRKVQYALSFFLFILLGVYGYLHATRGIDLTDEGMYLSTTMRFSMGDIPLRDELMSVLTQFNVLLSPFFMIYPEISLLHMRCLGLAIHTVSIFTLFLLFSRYGPLFFVALACGGIFFSNVFIMSPSYNNFSRDFSLIAMVCWLSSGLSLRRSVQLGLAILAGLFFTLMVLSYLPMFILIIIPLTIMVISHFFLKKHPHYSHSSRIFFLTFVSLMVCVVSTVIVCGLLPDVVQGFMEAAQATTVGSEGLWVKVHYVFKGFLNALPQGLKVAGIVIIALFFLAIQRGKTTFDVVCSILAFMTAFLPVALFLSQQEEASYRIFILSFALILSIIGFFLNDERTHVSKSDAQWKTIKNIALSWGLMTMFMYGVSSSNGFRQCIYGIAPIFVVGMITLYRFVNSHFSQSADITIRKTIWPMVYIAITVSFIIAGLTIHSQYTYREEEVDKLTARFTYPKLAGIYSTPEKVKALEGLLRYLKGKVKPHDYFLAYNYIPMLYFLTHTRPAYGAAWAMEQWPVSIRKRLVRDMIDEKRIPDYCIRMMAYPGVRWNTSNRITAYSKDDPLHAFVMSHYYLEKIMYPFEIWHRGHGPKFRLFDQMTPVFTSSFTSWKGPNRIDMHDLDKTAPPLVLQWVRGDFEVSCIPDKEGNILRVFPSGREKRDRMWIQLGYMLNKNGFAIPFQPGRKVIVTLSARISDRKKRPAQLFIQDTAKTKERNTVAIYNTSWEKYIVAKNIRDGATTMRCGILWWPGSNDEWLEGKDVRIYSCNGS